VTKARGKAPLAFIRDWTITDKELPLRDMISFKGYHYRLI
jgi:hypothetical protein